MRIKKHPHPWATESLLIKAQRYTEIMLGQDRTNWKFGFWSTLTLELLARAALANISPTLLANGKEWSNIYYALGNAPTTGKFIPRSIEISEVFKRLEAIIPEFIPEIHNFCSSHINHRNTELHSGELPFDGLGTSSWLPNYYLTCEILLKTVGKSLRFLIGPKEAATAKTLINSLKDKTAKSVAKTIRTYKDKWKELNLSNRTSKIKQAQFLVSRHDGHRVNCPSCGTISILHGSPTGAPTKEIKDEEVIERQSMLPSHFECFACELKIAGYSKLNESGLGDTFTATFYYSPAEYFDIDEAADLMYEEDFNE